MAAWRRTRGVPAAPQERCCDLSRWDGGGGRQSHLRENGELEAVADVVLFLYWEDYHDVEKAQHKGKENVCDVIVAKHRNGPVGR